MIVSEKVALTKWCPFARSPDEDTENAIAINRKYKGEADLGCLCLASKCMAWRTHGASAGYCGLACGLAA